MHIDKYSLHNEVFMYAIHTEESIRTCFPHTSNHYINISSIFESWETDITMNLGLWIESIHGTSITNGRM